MQRKSKKWTETEDNFLKANYGKMSAINIADKLQRTHHGILNQARELGLSIRKVHWWTEQEIAFLKESYQKMRAKDIAKKLGLATSQVHHKAKYLKLHKGVTNEQVEKAIELLKTTTFSQNQIARQVGMSTGSLYYIVRKANIKREPHCRVSSFESLRGFKHDGNKATFDRARILFAYRNLCYDCKKFFSAANLQIHHDFNQMPVQVFVLCKTCHKKRHNSKMV